MCDVTADELVPPIALRIEQRGEIAVVDPRRGGCGDRGLGVIGDAEAGGLDHAEIVGAVAGRQRVDVVEIEGVRAVRSASRASPRGRGSARDTSPVKLAVARRPARCRGSRRNPIIAATALVNSVKPPETRQV